jgi:hypothetical protein
MTGWGGSGLDEPTAEGPGGGGGGGRLDSGYALAGV